MTNIPVYPDLVDRGRSVTNSIVIPSQGLYGGGSGISAPCRVWHGDLIGWRTCWLGIWPGGFSSVRCLRARACGRWLAAPIGLACPHQPRLPPSASPAPICLACHHAESSALVLGIGLRLWQSALGFPSLSFIYKSISFPSLWIDRQLSFFVLSLLLSTVYDPGVSLIIDLFQSITWYALWPFRGMTWCPLPISVGWLGVPARWVDLVSPPFPCGLTWCPRSLGWLGVPTPSGDCVTTSCRLGVDIPFLLTWWRQPVR